MGLSTTYPDLTHSNFPNQEDKQKVFRDPSASEIPQIQQYNTYIASGNVASAIEYLNKYPNLNECIINADKLKSMYHAILAVERYFYDSILEKIYRIGNQKGDWNELMSSTATDEAYRLNKFDTVRYPVDGINQYFLIDSNDIIAGEIPTETDKYIQLTIKGDKGDAGYTPIKGIDYNDGYTPIKGVDYFDGQSGLGLSPRGAWVNNMDYWQYDLVSYNGYLWYCLEDNIAQEPNDDSTIWVRVNISMQSAVGTEIPTNLENGGIWMHLQDDGHVILKTKDENGEYVPMYPETQADYVKDANGKSLQRWIYQHYFDRDDVKITFKDEDPVFSFIATLVDSEIIVAKNIITDSVNTNGKRVSEFTAYDDTGIYVMYRCKRVEQKYDNYNVDSVPEVII